MTICGNSKAAYKTGFYIKSLKTMFDAGQGSYFKAKNILITHVHGDHSYKLPYILLDADQPDVYVPETTIKLFEKFVDSYF